MLAEEGEALPDRPELRLLLVRGQVLHLDLVALLEEPLLLGDQLLELAVPRPLGVVRDLLLDLPPALLQRVQLREQLLPVPLELPLLLPRALVGLDQGLQLADVAEPGLIEARRQPEDRVLERAERPVEVTELVAEVLLDGRAALDGGAAEALERLEEVLLLLLDEEDVVDKVGCAERLVRRADERRHVLLVGRPGALRHLLPDAGAGEGLLRRLEAALAPLRVGEEARHRLVEPLLAQQPVRPLLHRGHVEEELALPPPEEVQQAHARGEGGDGYLWFVA